MPRRSPYEGHNDFYLLDLWQRRAELDQDEIAALREEMSRRDLSIDEGAEEGPYREAPAPQRTGPPCPVCAQPTAEGRLVLSRTRGLPFLGAEEAVLADCIFRRSGRGDPKVVFRHVDSPEALLCEDCGTVVIRGPLAG
jgi:hypothetical protein